MIPGAANEPAACGVPGSGLGDTKRAVSFFQPFGARDSCPGGADDDELYRHLPQQGDAGATAALRRVTASTGVLSMSSRLLPRTDTPPFFGFVGAIAVRSDNANAHHGKVDCSPDWPKLASGKQTAKALSPA
jgi:hypothetical protein